MHARMGDGAVIFGVEVTQKSQTLEGAFFARVLWQSSWRHISITHHSCWSPHEHYRPKSMMTWRIHRPAAIIAEAFRGLSSYRMMIESLNQLLHLKSWKQTRMWRNATLEVYTYLWPHDGSPATQGKSDNSICFFNEIAYEKWVPSIGKSDETKKDIVSVIPCLESFSSLGHLFHRCFSMLAWIHVHWEWCFFPLHLTFSYGIRE